MGFKVGLALGGGAARGLAHLGVIKVLQQSRIPIDIISGTSVGAIIGSIYAANPDIDDVIERVETYLVSEDFDNTRLEFLRESSQETKGYFNQIKSFVKTGLFLAVSAYRSSFISEESFRKNLEHVLPQQNIEDCDIRLGIVAMNLETGEEQIFQKGSIIQNVMASAAIPGVFPPITCEKNSFVDGSWINPIPTSVAKTLGANFVIGVDVTPEMDRDDGERKGFEVTLRAAEGSRIALKRYSLGDADVALTIGLNDVHWADFSQVQQYIDEGERIANTAIDEIKKKIRWRRLKSKFLL